MDDINSANKNAYELVARQYAGGSPGEDDPVMRADCRNIFVSSLKGKDVLEIGCGPGVDASFLFNAGMNVTATDFAEEFIKIVNERFPQIQTRQMDMTSIDLPPNSFDGIYSFASFIHVPRAKSSKVLSDFYSLLRDDGVLFMSLIKSSKVSEYVIEDWAGRSNNPVLFTCYNEDEIKSALSDVGFREIEFFEVKSELYENIPRLVERGVTQYQVLAFKNFAPSINT